ncbi:MAG TPA: response regulator [Euryarchaeota archaeon]|nr:transcriptional regulatory protein ZraR [archaeon BMS3Bbin15]HDL15219.1 response regulator [Euryarchaeota archaeon]
MARILIAEDDVGLRKGLEEMMKEENYEVVAVDDGRKVLDEIKNKDFDVLLTDLVMPELGGMELLTEVKRIRPEMKVIIITAFATIDSAVEAIKKGASDYIEKPFKINEVQNTVRKVLEESKFEKESKNLVGKISDEVIKALSNPIRRKTVEYLYGRDKVRFREIRDYLKIEDPAKLSFHLKILKNAALVEQDQDRKYMITQQGKKTIEVLGEVEIK